MTSLVNEMGEWLSLCAKVLGEPWWIQLIILFYGAVALAFLCAVLWLVMFQLMVIAYVFIDAVWMPAWERIATGKLLGAGFTRDQIVAINKGVDPGAPANRGVERVRRILEERDINELERRWFGDEAGYDERGRRD